jgi:hypothetical protein
MREALSRQDVITGSLVFCAEMDNAAFVMRTRNGRPSTGHQERDQNRGRSHLIWRSVVSPPRGTRPVHHLQETAECGPRQHPARAHFQWRRPRLPLRTALPERVL